MTPIDRRSHCKIHSQCSHVPVNTEPHLNERIEGFAWKQEGNDAPLTSRRHVSAECRELLSAGGSLIDMEDRKNAPDAYKIFRDGLSNNHTPAGS